MIRFDPHTQTLYLDGKALAYLSERFAWRNLVGYNKNWPLHMAIVNSYYWYDPSAYQRNSCSESR